MATQKTTAKKRFFEVKAPITATQIHLYAFEPSELEGRIIRLDLTKALRGKSFELKLKVKKENESLVGEPISLVLAQSYIRRTVRRGTDYVEDSFEIEGKDAKVRIKPFLITRKRVSRSIRNALRVAAQKNTEAYVKIRTSKEVFTDLTTNKLQRDLASKLKKIYPLALCEIRSLEITQHIEMKKEEKTHSQIDQTKEVSEVKEKKAKKKKDSESENSEE